jgi:AAA+ ATPase superfamily predicted ATPase
MSDKKPELLFFYGPTASGKSSVIWTLLEGKAEGTQLGDGKTQSPTGPYTRPIRGIIGGREFII